MGMTVQRRKDDRLPHVFMHKIADIRGGVSVKSSELGNDFLHEGAVLSVPDKGICHVVKLAEVVAEVSDSGKTININKKHNFKVGDFIMNTCGAKAYAITKIDATNKAYDVISIGTAIGAIATGDFVIEAKAQSADNTSELKYIPLSVSGTGKPIAAGQNIDTDAWLIGVTKGNRLPKVVADYLTGIINY